MRSSAAIWFAAIPQKVPLARMDYGYNCVASLQIRHHIFAAFRTAGVCLDLVFIHWVDGKDREKFMFRIPTPAELAD